MHTSRLTRAPGDPVLVQKIFAPTPALQAYSEFHSSKSARRLRLSGSSSFLDGIHLSLRLSCREGVLSASCRQPGVFVPSPAQAGQQTVNMITRVTHAEPAPDQAGDSFRGPDWGIKPVSHWPLLQQIGKPCQFLTSQFGAASRLWPPPQSVVSSRAVPQCPPLDGLYAHSKRAGDRGG